VRRRGLLDRELLVLPTSAVAVARPRQHPIEAVYGRGLRVRITMVDRPLTDVDAALAHYSRGRSRIG